jgi:hypothetical protein
MSATVVDQGGAQAEEVGLKRVLGTRDLIVFGVTMMFPLAPIASTWTSPARPAGTWPWPTSWPWSR